MALDAATQALVYRQALARLSQSQGREDLNSIARAIYQNMRGDDPYIQVVGIVRQAFRAQAFAQLLTSRNTEIDAIGTVPVDPSIPVPGPRYQARVVVTLMLPDGRTVSTAVNVPINDTATPDQILAAAIAAVQRDTQQQLSPDSFNQTSGRGQWTATIIALGRSRDL